MKHLSLLFGCVFALYAQDAQVSGIVKDPSSASIPHAKVSIKNLATGLERSAQSNIDGLYTIPSLPPGDYALTVQAPGFRTSIREGVTLEVEQAARIDFNMQVGRSDQSITVSANASAVNTESAAVGTVVDQQFVANLPLNGRSFQSLISLTPGVVIATTGSGNRGQFSINGQRTGSNYFMIDGVSVNAGAGGSGEFDESGGGSGVQVAASGGYNNMVSVDAMQEFRIETSSFAPEYGRLPGGQISIVTRTGTNRFHGDLFEYFRNTVLDANNWFNNANRLPRSPERQNDFGAVIGGPIIPNKLFFFFSYEGLRLGVPGTVTASVPSLSARQNAIPAVQPLLNAYPVPTQPQCVTGTPGCDPNVATFTGAFSNPSVLNATSVRFDWNASAKMTVFGRYNYSPTHGDAQSGVVEAFRTISNLTTLTIGQTYLPRTTMANDLRFNYSHANSFTQGVQDNLGGAAVIPNSLQYLPGYSAANGEFQFIGSLIGNYTLGDIGNTNSPIFNGVDTFSWIHGKHQMKFGGDYRHLAPVALRAQFLQSIGFQLSTQSFVTGIPSRYAVTTNIPKTAIYQNMGLYAQDAWKITPRLTLTYGLRWDWNPAPGPNGHDFPIVYTHLDYNNLAATTVAADGSSPPFHTQWNAFAPRVGIVYQLSQNPNWTRVVRGGFGLFYDTAAGANGFVERPAFSQVTTSLGPLPIPASLQVLPAINIVPPFGSSVIVSGVDLNLRLPRTYQWNVAVEQGLGAHQVLTVTYAGAIGRDLLYQQRLIVPPNNTVIGGQLYAVGSLGTSDYHSLQTLFQRRFSHGMQAMASYTWSHSIDNGSVGSVQLPSVAYEPIGDYRGNSDFDIRHSFQSAVTYDIPSPGNSFLRAILGHWGTDAIFRARSAPPIDLVDTRYDLAALQPFLPSGLSNPLGAIFNVRPDVIPGVPLYISDPNAPGGQVINRAAFVIHPLNTVVARQGTLGRNALRAFPWNQLDLSIRREFPIHESWKLQLRADFFNIMNHPNFGMNPNQTFGVNDINNALFGRAAATLNNSLGGGYNPTNQIGGPRDIQLSLKLFF